MDTLASANNKFGLNLFKVIRKNFTGKNAFMSPMSISAALSMTQIGARGKTASEMAQVLGWESENGDKIHKQFQAYFKILQEPSDQYQLSTANRIYLEQTFTVADDFKNKTNEHYLAEPVLADFINDSASEAIKINNWVEEQTQNKIKDLFGEGVLNNMTRMVLVNAIYFKGKWENQFEKCATSPKPFKLSQDETVDVPTMTNKQTYGIYKDSELKFTAIELPYKGYNLGMIIILPNEDFGLEELVENLTAEKLEAIIDGVTTGKEKIQLYLPKFEITSGYMLKEPLTNLGMSDAFNTSEADFTGMTGQRDLALSEVVHKAFVQVNEEGTEAAAATGAVMMMRCCMPRPVPIVKVDHPFLFIISDNRAGGSMLFLGQVNNPTV